MNKTPEEARETLDKLTWNATCDEDEQAVLMEAIDAYGAARELKGHVGACEAVPPDGEPVFHCGDGWYCDVAKQYIKEEK